MIQSGLGFFIRLARKYLTRANGQKYILKLKTSIEILLWHRTNYAQGTRLRKASLAKKAGKKQRVESWNAVPFIGCQLNWHPNCANPNHWTMLTMYISTHRRFIAA